MVTTKVLRPADVAGSGGRLMVPPSFGVAVTSTFSKESYEEFLKGSLPMDHLQVLS